MRPPALPRPNFSEAIQAALAQAVLLAVVPASARGAVPDAVLARFLARPRPAPGGDPWAAPVGVPPAPAPPRPRAMTRPAASPPAAAGPAAAAAPSPLASLRRALAEAEAALRQAGETAAAAAMDQSHAAAGQFAALLAMPVQVPLRRITQAAAPATAAPPVALALAEAALVRLQARLDATTALAISPVREALAALGPLASQPMATALLAPLAGLPDVPAATSPPLAAPARLPPRPVPRGIPPVALPPLPVPAARMPGWGARTAPALAIAPPPALPEGETPPPYGPETAGALSGLAAIARLLRRQGLGPSGGGTQRLAELVEATEAWCGTLWPLDPADTGRLQEWGGLARQLGFLRDRTGLDPWDPALGEVLAGRAAWLNDRPDWPERGAAMQGLMHWLPLADCADAYGLDGQGEGAMARLGATLRQVAATPLPPLQDPAAMAQRLAALDSMAALREGLGLDPADPALREKLARLAGRLDGLAPPAAETAGALDRSCLGLLGRLDLTQAGALGLEGFGAGGIPLLASGLPALTTLETARRLGMWPLVPEPSSSMRSGGIT